MLLKPELYRSGDLEGEGYQKLLAWGKLLAVNFKKFFIALQFVCRCLKEFRALQRTVVTGMIEVIKPLLKELR